MDLCVQCGCRDFEAVLEEEQLEVDGHIFLASMPAQRCVQCGETYVSGAAIGRFELLVAAELARTGSQSGEAFKFMRKTLGMRAIDLAKLLDVTHETISRWETGKRALDRTALATLGALVLDRLLGRNETLERLQALCEPRPLGRSVHLGECAAA